MLKKLENNVGARMHPCLILEMLGDGEAARQRPIVLHLTSLTFMELAEDGKKFGGMATVRQDFPQSIMADSIKGLTLVIQQRD